MFRSSLLLFLVLGFSAQALAQGEPKQQVVEVVLTPPTEAQPVWTLFFLVENPCNEVAQSNHCQGPTRDVAICLAQTRTKLPQNCANYLMNAALTHGDLQVAQLLDLHEHATVDLPVEEQPLSTNDRPVHPIVTALRQDCSDEFARGICGFANNPRVCPKKLLKCLVTNHAQLSDTCTVATRTEIIAIASRVDPLRVVCSLLSWALLLLAAVVLCTCCVRAIARCCCKRSVAHRETKVAVAVVKGAPAASTYPAPSAPLGSEDSDLEMALLMSAAEASQVNNGNGVVSGIPVTSKDQL